MPSELHLTKQNREKNGILSLVTVTYLHTPYRRQLQMHPVVCLYLTLR